MAYTEVSSKNWFQRLGESFGGIVTGFVIIALATWLLWWNEGRTFKTAGAIGEAEMLTQDVADISKINPALEGKLIHAIGRAETKDILRDPVFGIELEAINIAKSVEYYQWEEHSHSETRKKLGGGEETVTTYTYDTGWTSSPVDSNSFKDPEYRGRNTTLARIEDSTIWAKNVSFGAYKLPDFLIHSIGGKLPMTLTSVDVNSVANIISVPKNYTESADKLITVSGSTVYIGKNLAAPEVGDVRVNFSYVPEADVSIVAQVIRDTFEKFTASNGYTFSRLDMGKVGIARMFEGARSDNNIMAWLLRIAGIFLVVLGLRMIFHPLSVLGDVIPLLGTIIGAGMGVVAFLLGLAWSLIVIALAWVRFRPLVAGGLIAAALLLIYLSYAKGKKSAAQ
ncbi:MAG: TMEM43 family protein [Synergistaceae bacterium]|nr:TMEM43 family protein [Synergistaceae bacterium]